MEGGRLRPLMSSPVGPGNGDDCIFCRIVARTAPAWIVYEDAHHLAFLDLFPFTRGHLLVIPKRHVDRLVDLPAAERGPFLNAVAEVSRRVERLARDYNISLNQGALAGQIVFHLHAHIIPRYGEANPFRVEARPRVTESDARELLEILAPP